MDTEFGNGSKMDQKWIKNGSKMDQKWTKMTGDYKKESFREIKNFMPIIKINIFTS